VSQHVQILLEDDLDGSEAAETITFGLDGSTYEIDLSEDHALTFRAAFIPFAAAARTVKTAPPRKTRVRNTRPDTAAIREWAKTQGMPVNEKGRIPASIIAEYEAANSPEEPSTTPEDVTPEAGQDLNVYADQVEVTTAEVVE